MRGRAEAVLHGLSSRRSAGRASCRVAGESGRDHGRSSGNQRGQPVVMVEQGRVLPWWQDPKPFHRLPAAARPAGIRQRASVGVCQTGASHLNPPSAWRMTPCGSSSTPPISTAPGQADQPTAVVPAARRRRGTSASGGRSRQRVVQCIASAKLPPAHQRWTYLRPRCGARRRASIVDWGDHDSRDSEIGRPA
jgi:hypothetical protein